MLRAGARVAVVAPAGVYPPARLAAGLAVASGWGLTMVAAPNLGARHRFHAGTVAQRASDLRWALTAPDIDAVWFARGGAGTVHLLDQLPYDALDTRPIIGFSDASALFAALAGRGRAVHGPVLTQLGEGADEDSREVLRALLMEGRPAPLPGERVAGPVIEVQGHLTGGNLTVLASLCGTPWAWSARDGIAVLEDIGEAPYRLDRCLAQLLAAGAFEGVRGVALGEFTDCSPPAGADWTLLDALLERLEPLGVPIVGGLPVGHGPRNRAWVVGAKARLGPGGVFVEQA